MSNNPYHGINAYVNSLLQTPGTVSRPGRWAAFHSSHINHIADEIGERLPPGYVVYAEQSLQLRGVEWRDEVVNRQPRPDISIFQNRPIVNVVGSGTALAERPPWEAALDDILDPMNHPTAIVIRTVEDDEQLERIVTRIELLSPSNKPGGTDEAAYAEKRLEALGSGTPLIEIDYLHEQRTVIATYPVYPHESGSHPYLISISDPRTSEQWPRGRVAVYHTSVDEPLPIIPIPLLGDDVLSVSFDAAYQRTYTVRGFHTLSSTTKEPARMHTYSADDQARIRAVMAREQAT